MGSKNQGTEKVHGAPLGSDDIANVKKNLGFDPEKSFYIPKEVGKRSPSDAVANASQVYDHYSKVNKECEEAEKQWCDLMKKYKDAYPHEVRSFPHHSVSYAN